MSLRQRIAACLLCLLLLSCLPALAEEPSPSPSAPPALSPVVEDRGLEIGAHSVRYPQLTGLADAELEARVNQQLLESGDIEALLARLPVVMSGQTPLRVSYRYTLEGDVFSCAMSALGPVKDGRSTEIWSAVNVDLHTGEAIRLADLFTDEKAARDAIAAYLDEQIAPIYVGYPQSGQVQPMPEVFSLSPEGLSLYYPIEQLCTLHDRAGVVTILWCEMRPWLKTGEGSVLRRIGAEDHLTLQDSSAQRIAEWAERGALPGIPVKVGDSMQEAVDTYRLLTDPDLCDGSRMVSLEGGAFHRVYLLTDALSRTWSASTVQALRADRLNFFGLCVGETTRDAWRKALGAPAATVTLDAERADKSRLCPGQSDYYLFGDYRLRLHADENGVLRSVMLSP